MKKICRLLFTAAAAVFLLLTLNGCSASSSATAEEVYDAIDTAFHGQYGHGPVPASPIEVDGAALQEKFHLSEEMVDGYKGEIAGMMTNCDMLLVVKAKDGQLDAVRSALNEALQDQKDAFLWYAVMDNPERLESAKVVTEGDFAALLLVGISPDDPDAQPDFSSDVALAEEAFRQAAG